MMLIICGNLFISISVGRRIDVLLLTCHTPTQALAIKINIITKGSTNAVVCDSVSSNHAKTWRVE